MKKFIAGAALVTTLFGTSSAALAETTAPAPTTATAPAADTTTTAPAPTTTTTTTDTTTATPAPTTTSTTDTTTVTPAPTTTTTTEVQLPDVTLTPDKLFYTLKLWVEQIKVAITRDAVEKAALLEQQAQTRLAEAKLMADAGKMDLAQKAMEEANAKMEEAQKAIAAAKAADKDIAKLTEQVTASEAKFTTVLTNVLDKAPEAVKTQMEPVVAELLVQVATTGDTAATDDAAKEEAEKVAKEAKLEVDLSALQPRMVLVLNAMSKASGKSLDEVLAMYKKNPGLGNIAKALNLKMGSVQHAAQIEWKKVGKDGKIEIEVTTQPTTTQPAPATTLLDAAKLNVIKVEIKGEAKDDEDEKDEARKGNDKLKGYEKEHSNNGKGNSNGKGKGKH